MKPAGMILQKMLFGVRNTKFSNINPEIIFRRYYVTCFADLILQNWDTYIGFNEHEYNQTKI